MTTDPSTFRRVTVAILAALVFAAVVLALDHRTADAVPVDPDWCSKGDPVVCRCPPDGQIVGPDDECPDPPTTTTAPPVPSSTVPPPTTVIVCGPGETQVGDACLIPPSSITRPAPAAQPTPASPRFTG